MADDLFDPDTFRVYGPLYAIGPTPQPVGIGDLMRAILTLGTDEGTVVPVFTDLPAAEEFLERHGEEFAYKPFTFASPTAQVGFLENCLRMGWTLLAFDPHHLVGRRFPVTKVIDAIRNRPG